MMTHQLWCRTTYVLTLASAVWVQPARAADDVPLAQSAGVASHLVAALAFNLNGAAVLQDVGVEGTFPGDFRLTSLPPPPAEVLATTNFLSSTAEAPAFHIATIAAVPRDHPSVLRPPTDSYKHGPCTEAACTDEVRICAADGARCADVTLACNVVGKDCKITAIDGDLALVRQSLHLLAGRANDHALLYVTADAPAGSMVSQLYAGGAPLASGYHLLQRRGSGEEAQERMLRCEVGSERLLLARYNQEHGRSFPDMNDVLEHVTVTRYNAKHGTQHKAFRDISDDAALQAILDGVYTDFLTQLLEDMLARKCLLDSAAFGAVGAPGSRTLAVPLAPAPPKIGDVFLVGTPWRVGDPPLDWP